MTEYSPAKLGDIREYCPSDIPQFQTLRPQRMREDFAVVTEEGKSFLVVKVIPENTQKKTSHPCMQ